MQVGPRHPAMPTTRAREGIGRRLHVRRPEWVAPPGQSILLGGTVGPLALLLAGAIVTLLAVFLATANLLGPGSSGYAAGVGLAIFLLGAIWGFWRARPGPRHTH